MNIVITGNIGCGKSTIAKILADKLPAYSLHDVDQLVHDLYSNSRFTLELQHAFKTTVRQEISDIVFKDDVKRKQLEKMSEKYLDDGVTQLMYMQNAIVEFPLYYEMGMRANHSVNRVVIAVICDAETQMTRVKARNGFSDEKIQSIMHKQLSTELKASMADYVIYNEGDVSDQISKLLKDLMPERVRERALQSFSAYKDDDGTNYVWDAINAAYTEPQRHYHTLHHIGAMFDHYDRLVSAEEIKPNRAIELAIWFHDFVYQTGAEYAMNEFDSVKAMVKLLRNPEFSSVMWFTADDINLAGEYILSTKGHKVKSSYVMGDDERVKANEYFLDIDLTILGTPASICDVFDDNIRLEFSQYPDDQFRAGRVQAMTEFKNRPYVFYTDSFRNQYEAMAQQNLNYIIQKWS